MSGLHERLLAEDAFLAQLAHEGAQLPSPVAKRAAVTAIAFTLSVPTVASAAETHRIERGDTLSEIAEAQDTTVEMLAKANKIRNIHRIYAGDTLIIPEDKPSTKHRKEVDPDDCKVVKVPIKKGTTEWEVSQLFDRPLSEVLRMNKDRYPNPRRLPIGGKLNILDCRIERVPTKSKAEEPAKPVSPSQKPKLAPSPKIIRKPLQPKKAAVAEPKLPKPVQPKPKTTETTVTTSPLANSKLQKFVDRYGERAAEIAEDSGIPVEVMLAQGALESAYGTSELAKKGNNFFGITAGRSWDGETMKLREDGPDFRVYKDAEESIEDYAKILHNGYYDDALKTDDPAEFVERLVDENGPQYTPDEGYAENVTKLADQIEVTTAKPEVPAAQKTAPAPKPEVEQPVKPAVKPEAAGKNNKRSKRTTVHASARGHKAPEIRILKPGLVGDEWNVESTRKTGAQIRKELKEKYHGVSGKLSKKELEVIGGNWGGHQLHPQAAEGFRELAAAFKNHFGKKLRITDSYRSYQAQVNAKRNKPRITATPGTSEHGWGLAVDFASRINSFSTEEHKWMKNNASKYGWIHPEWAQKNGKNPEPWHWEYR